MEVPDLDIFDRFIDLVGEFQLLAASVSRLNEAIRSEATRAEAAESTRDEAQNTAAELRASAAAANAGANQAAKALTAVQDELTKTKIQLDLSERQRSLFEEKCSEMGGQIAVLEKELQECKNLQTSYTAMQKQYIELHERIQTTTDTARSEASRLENELRRVEKCVSAGSELRERARLAAAAHARERRLTAVELQDTTRELQTANAEVMRLKVQVSELQCRLRDVQEKSQNGVQAIDEDILMETKAALEAERNTTVRLERALAAALADNATLAAEIHREDNKNSNQQTLDEISNLKESISTNICPIDSFLAD